jgi:hypothetical protein
MLINNLLASRNRTAPCDVLSGIDSPALPKLINTESNNKKVFCHTSFACPPRSFRRVPWNVVGVSQANIPI